MAALIRDNRITIRYRREVGMALDKCIEEIVLGECLAEMTDGIGVDDFVGIEHNYNVVVKIVPEFDLVSEVLVPVFS